MTSFTDNILVRIKKEKENNKIIKKVVRKLTEINLNVKYKWKIKEVRFIKIVIKLNRIKIKKIEEILN